MRNTGAGRGRGRLASGADRTGYGTIVGMPLTMLLLTRPQLKVELEDALLVDSLVVTDDRAQTADVLPRTGTPLGKVLHVDLEG